MSNTVSNFKREGGISLQMLQWERASSHVTGEPHGFPRIAVGFLNNDWKLQEPLMWPQGCPVSVRVARASCGLLSSQYSANRPHLGLGPETPCSSLVATRISGCIQSSPGESGLFSSGIKNSVLLSSCDRYLLEPIEWPKGCQASCGVVREYSG